MIPLSYLSYVSRTATHVPNWSANSLCYDWAFRVLNGLIFKKRSKTGATMRVVSVINYKGGVGKTSLTANLAAQLAWQGRSVLLVDLDAQASLTFSFIAPDVWEKDFSETNTIKSWFESFDTGAQLSLASLVNTPQRVQHALRGRGKLDVIYSHLGLINVDLELATKLGGASLAQAKKNFLSIHRRLADGISSDIPAGLYDIILIDCPPNFNIVTKTAIIASDYILVPARPDYLSTLGISYLLRSVNSLVKDYNDFAGVKEGQKAERIAPKVLGVVFTMIQEYGSQPISAQRPFIAQMARVPGISVFKSYIKRNDSLFAGAPQYGVPVVLHGYNSGSHQSVVDGLESVSEEFATALRW
jgi:chromosome partitioning protein